MTMTPTVHDSTNSSWGHISEAPTEDESGEWVVKARRNGGSSIIDVAPDKNKARALAHELNEHHQTTRYYIERYDEKIHAYSRHG